PPGGGVGTSRSHAVGPASASAVRRVSADVRRIAWASRRSCERSTRTPAARREGYQLLVSSQVQRTEPSAVDATSSGRAASSTTCAGPSGAPASDTGRRPTPELSPVTTVCMRSVCPEPLTPDARDDHAHEVVHRCHPAPAARTLVRYSCLTTGRTRRGRQMVMAQPATRAAAARPLEAVVADLRALTHELAAVAGPEALDTAAAGDQGLGARLASASPLLRAVSTQLDVLRMTWLPRIEVDGRWALDGSRTFRTWLARREQVTLRTASRDVLTGERLLDHLPATLAAALEGRLGMDQVRAMVDAGPT